ncbi:GNAT family N-acetyltransferase [Paenibacillus sp. N1-5-1-14]|uniref:GNAT family N-acetyltransferase n=1 Tax=Paenibacillus radicibacter TaxID=2972488 RepID=UPI002158ED8F|nr:GNAT family N-acetyltransferase [Paenibacillus radicibacter]MCR8644451.1 GNAT family N-acetyltransferase [Paenibacillus radicibacter]
MTIEIETGRLILKTIDESYTNQLLNYVLRNQHFLEEWEVARTADYYTLDMQRRLISGDLLQIEQGQVVKVWMYTKEQPDVMIGSIALSNIVRGAFLSCFLGYRLDHAAKNKGYMTEGIRRMIEVAFEELELHRIEANIMPKNAASLKVVQKLGFYEEGLAKNYLRINGKWEDHIHMVLRNEQME